MTVATGTNERESMSDSFFTTEDGLWFQPTTHTRGPWDEHACHAGPPTGLLARAVEQLLPDQRLSRLTINLLRPVPYAGFSIDARVVRLGRTVSLTEASVVNSDGKAIVTAAGMHLSEAPPGSFSAFESGLPTFAQSIGTPDQATPGRFPLADTLHTKPAFNGDGVEVRYVDGHDSQPGPTEAWMRTVPLLPDEISSPFQRICPLADCGNAFGRNAEPQHLTYMNTDLTLMLHRDPEGEWLGTRSVCYWQPTGIGLADALLFDANGAVGRAMQTLILR